VCQWRFQQQDIDPTGSKSDTGIQLFLEYQRNAIAEHIAQHTAKNTGDHRCDSRND